MATQLLNDDGTASMATALMTSHHAFRRDLSCFERALQRITDGDHTRIDAVRDEWARFREGLHHHHVVEDTGLFPDLRTRHPDLAGVLDELDAHHRAIDPLLERGDLAFADLARRAAEALAVTRELATLLAAHLDLEEPHITPHLRDAREFPPPPTDEAAAMYADGFAWSTAGLAPSVLEPLFAMLPKALVDRLPAARDAFAIRCERVWGYVHATASTTSVPDSVARREK